jgi:hypothetical protein
MIKTKNMTYKVVVEQDEDGTFSLYNEAGQMVEQGFQYQVEAEEFAKDCGFEVVKTFFI